MRILSVGNMYPPESLGGYEVMWRSWVEEARSRGHDVEVLTSDFRREKTSDPGAEGDDGVHRVLRWYWRDYRFPRYAPWTKIAIERHNARVLDSRLGKLDPDVIVWWGMGGMSTSLIEQARRRGIPGVAVLADYWIKYAPKADGWMRLFHERPRLGRAAERLTGLTATVDMGESFTAVFTSEFCKLSAVRVSDAFADGEVFHHGPDTEVFRPVPPAPEWGWRLLCLGRLNRNKGTDLAVAALEHLPVEATLRIVGGGDDEFRAELQRLAGRIGVSDRVRFDQLPHSETATAYARADAVLFPVRWSEPWGLVPLEAMAVGRPVIASGRGGSREYLEDGSNALVFNPDDGAGALASAIQCLAEDPALRERLVSGGRTTVEAMANPSFSSRVQDSVERVAAAGLNTPR